MYYDEKNITRITNKFDRLDLRLSDFIHLCTKNYENGGRLENKEEEHDYYALKWMITEALQFYDLTKKTHTVVTLDYLNKLIESRDGNIMMLHRCQELAKEDAIKAYLLQKKIDEINEILDEAKEIIDN